MSEDSGAAHPLRSDDFTFLSRREYFLELAERVARTGTGDRVMVVTHDFNPDEPLVVEIMDKLMAASARGVNVQFAIDERSFPLMQRVPLNKRTERLLHSHHAMLKSLETAGVSYAVTNKTYHRLINRFSGRAHIKLAVINDVVYVGGCNLLRPNQIDMMVRWRDRKAATWLYELMESVVAKGDTWSTLKGHDRTYELDEHTKLLMDAGKPRQSLIFENALQLIDEAKQWIVMSCQYFPNSTTGRHLSAAHKRGVDVTIYYNHPSVHNPGFNTLIHAVVLRERMHHPKKLFADQMGKHVPYIHAKLLATESACMVGSHNYVVTGVNLGTAELTLLRRDPVFSKRAVAHLRSQLAPYITS